MMPSAIAMGNGAAAKVDVTIVMPCLNEAKWLAACIANAKGALTRNGAIVMREDLTPNGPVREHLHNPAPGELEHSRTQFPRALPLAGETEDALFAEQVPDPGLAIGQGRAGTIERHAALDPRIDLPHERDKILDRAKMDVWRVVPRA